MNPGKSLGFLLLCFLSNALFSQEKNLDYFIRQGLESSPVLKELELQVRANSVDSMLIKAVRLPQLSFNTFLSYAPVINGYGYSEPITNGGNFISTINLTQSLFNKKITDAKYDRIGIRNQSLASNITISENDLKKAITAQYLQAFSISNDIYFSKSIVERLEDEEAILRKLTEAGIYSQSDYLNFKVEVQGRRLILNELRIQYRKELSNLNYICGITDTSMYLLVLPDLNVNFPVPPETSVYFLPYRLDSLRINNERNLLDRSYKPAVSWFADAGLMNNDPGEIYKNFGASLGFSFSLPVYDGNQKKLNYEKLKFDEETRNNYKQFFAVQYNEQLRQLASELEQTREMIPQINQELELAKAVIQQSRELLNNGTIGVTDFLLALRNLISIQQYKNQYDIKELQIINEINYWRH